MLDVAAALEALKPLKTHLKHLLIEGGPNALVTLDEPGPRTVTNRKVFVPGLVGSPIGSIIGPGDGYNTIRVIYSAREVLASIEEQFPS